MKDKIQRAWNKNRKYLISFVILWFILTIVFVVPLTCGIVEGYVNGKFEVTEFTFRFVDNIKNILGAIGKTFSGAYIGTFLSVIWKYTLIYLIVCVVGFYKMLPKHEFSGIEHGSSDWSENGEQYKVLDRKKGLILAEENYLPLDKRGNVNVLIVGRIRIW